VAVAVSIGDAMALKVIAPCSEGFQLQYAISEDVAIFLHPGIIFPLAKNETLLATLVVTLSWLVDLYVATREPEVNPIDALTGAGVVSIFTVNPRS
jgi:hypothetical protein